MRVGKILSFLGSLQPHGIALIVVIGASGCGLSDYQSRMDAQLARLKDYDDANRLLDDPIEIPRIVLKDPKDGSAKDQAAWPFEIFLRLPKGYFTFPKEKEPYNYPFPFYRYAGGSEGATSIFIAAAWIQDPKTSEDQAKYHVAKFRDYVRGALQDYYFKGLKVPIIFPDKVELKAREVKALTPYPNPSLPLTIPFKTFLLTDAGAKGIDKDKQSVLEVYLREEGGKQICIAVQRPVTPTNATALNKSIETCLSTLDISSEATSKRFLYNEYKKKRAN
jgi:hypothetical protein